MTLLASFGNKTADMSFLFHHFLVGISIAASVHYSFVTWILAVLLFNELSTIFMNCRWFLLALGHKDSKLYVCNGVLFVLAFFLCRVLFLPFVFYFYATKWGLCWSVPVPTVLRTLSALNFPILWVLNLVWFRKLVRGALKALRGGDEAKKD